jgi:hypothetical protein
MAEGRHRGARILDSLMPIDSRSRDVAVLGAVFALHQQ